VALANQGNTNAKAALKAAREEGLRRVEFSGAEKAAE